MTFKDYSEEGDLVLDEDKGLSSEDCVITDACYNEGQLIGTAMCKEAEIQVINDNYDLADKEFQLEVGVDTSNVVLNGPDEYDVSVDVPEGKSEQETRSGKNLFNANNINNSSVKVLNNGKTIVMPIATSGNGYTTTNKTLQQLCPDLNVGDTVFLYGNTTSQLNRYIYLKSLWHFGTERTITQEDLDAAVILYGNRYHDGETGQVTLTDMAIMLKSETDTTWEAYGASPSPKYPSEIKSVGDDINLFDANSSNISYSDNFVTHIIDSSNKITTNNSYSWARLEVTIAGLEANTDYTISTNIANDNELNCGLWGATDNISMSTNKNFKSTITKQTDSSGNLTFYFYTNYSSSTTATGIVVFDKIKLQKGTAATSYSEYGKGTVEVKQEGKNKFRFTNENIWQGAGNNYEILDDKLNKIHVYGNWYIGFLTDVKPNTYYTIMFEKEINVLTGNTGVVNIYDGDKKERIITITGNRGTFNSGSLNKIYVVLYCGGGTGYEGDVIFSYINLVEGLYDNITMPEFEPYFSNSYVLQVSEPLRSLPNGVCDTIEEDGIHRRVGIGKFQAVNQLYDSRGFKYGTNSIKSINTSAENINIICDKAIVNAKTNDIYITNYGNTLVIIGATDDTVETFNEKFAGAEYIYELAEEVIEPIFKEYVPYGTYTIKQYEDVKSNNKYKIIAYDYMDKLNEEFVDNDNYPKTLKQFYIDFAGYYGLEVEEQTLPNENFIIKEKPALENMTGRSILGCIAELFGSFAKINRFDRIQMYLKEDTDIEFSLDDMNSKLETDNRYGPVNVVTIGLSSVEGENVTLQDEESIAQYGETTIRIDDNPFVYTEALREEVIEELYNRLKGFSYIPVSFNHKARLYTDCGDAIKVQNMEETGYVETMILNQTVKIPRTRQSTIETKALTNTQQEKKYISKTKQKNTQTEIVVDKINQNIVGIIETQDEIQDKIFKMESDISGLDVSLTTAGGNNFLSFAPEYWELEIQQKLQEGIEEIGSFEGITETSLNNLLNTTITNYEKTDTSITFNYNQNKILIDTDLSITANVNLESISSRSTYYEELRKNTISSLGYLLKNENILQRLILPNGIYTISFLYKTVSLGATNKLIIDNGIKTEYELEDIQNFTDFKIQTEVEQEDGTTGTEEHYLSFEVNNNEVSIGFSSDSDNAIIISDLMLNSGSTKLDWTQNSNETITDTVKIGKGIEISSTADDVKFKADTDGIRILDADTDEVTSKFTRAGTETNNLIAHNSANLGGLMFRKVNDKVWITFIPD